MCALLHWSSNWMTLLESSWKFLKWLDTLERNRNRNEENFSYFFMNLFYGLGNKSGHKCGILSSNAHCMLDRSSPQHHALGLQHQNGRKLLKKARSLNLPHTRVFQDAYLPYPSSTEDSFQSVVFWTTLSPVTLTPSIPSIDSSRGRGDVLRAW